MSAQSRDSGGLTFACVDRDGSESTPPPTWVHIRISTTIESALCGSQDGFEKWQERPVVRMYYYDEVRCTQENYAGLVGVGA